MTAEAIVRRARADGVTLFLAEDGAVKARGDGAAVNRWLAPIRESRGEIVTLLKAGTTQTTTGQPTACSAAPAVDTASESVVRAWLATIGETDPEVIRHVLAQCVEKPDLRQYLFSLTDDGAMPENRRTCRQCANLRGDICAAQANGGKLYRPQVDTLFRCEWYRPSASDDDQRTACDRWPGLSQRARQS